MLEELARTLIRKFPLYPVSVVFEPTTYCNLKCKACRRWYWDNPSKLKNLTLSMYREALKNIGWVPSIKFIGPDGEPLCNPEFNNLVEYNSSKNTFTQITTNGTLVTPDMVRFWKRHKVARVVVSFDSCDPSEYEAIRLGSNFNKVRDVCKLISSNGIPLQMNMVTFERNVDKVLDYAKFAASLGACEVYYLRPHNVGEASSIPPKITLERQKLFRETEDFLRVHKIKYIKPMRMGTYFRTCIQPFAAPYILLDGSIRPCCTIFGDYKENLEGQLYQVDGSKYTLGNIYQDKLINIWNSKNAKDLRKFIKETDYKEGSEIPLNQIASWKKNPIGCGRFEQCRSCLWRWSVEG